jgi:hypothetical protein
VGRWYAQPLIASLIGLVKTVQGRRLRISHNSPLVDCSLSDNDFGSRTEYMLDRPLSSADLPANEPLTVREMLARNVLGESNHAWRLLWEP